MYHTRIKREVSGRQVLTADADSGGYDSLRCLFVPGHVLLGLAAAAPQGFEVSNLTLVEVVLVFIENDHSVGDLRNAVIYRRYSGDGQVRRVDAVDEERLKAGGERSLARAFQAEEVGERKTVLDGISRHSFPDGQPLF